MVKKYKVSVINKFWDTLYSRVTIGNITELHNWKLLRSCYLKRPFYHKRKNCSHVWWWMVTRHTVVITLLYIMQIYISNHLYSITKPSTMLYINYISVLKMHYLLLLHFLLSSSLQSGVLFSHGWVLFVVPVDRSTPKQGKLQKCLISR